MIHHPYNSRSFSAWQYLILFNISSQYSFLIKRSIQLVTAKLTKYILSLSASLYFLLIYKCKIGLCIGVIILFGTDTPTLFIYAAYLRQWGVHHPYNSRSFSAWQYLMLFNISSQYSFRIKRSIQLVTAKLTKYILSLSANLYFLLIYKCKIGLCIRCDYFIWHRYANALYLCCKSAPVGGKLFYWVNKR